MKLIKNKDKPPPFKQVDASLNLENHLERIAVLSNTAKKKAKSSAHEQPMQS